MTHPRVLFAAIAALGCSAPAAAPITARSQTRSAPSCAGRDEAPLRTGAGVDAVRCVAVGAAPPVAAALWPELPADGAPVAYVDPAAVDGDGTRARPFATVAAALAATPSPRTLVLSRGEHAVDDLVLDADRTLLGAGSEATVIALRGGVAVTGAATRVTLSGLSVRGDRERAVAVPLVAVRGASLALREVTLTGGLDALQASDARVDADGLTLRSAARYGVWASGGGSLALTRFASTDHGAQGVRVEGPHVRLTRGYVARNQRHGVVIVGDGDATGGVAQCFADGAPGPRDCIDAVTLLSNGVAGLFLAGARTVEARRVFAVATRLGSVADGAAGDGVAVTGGASLALDEDLVGVARRGHGSAFVDNARAGVVAQGVGTVVSLHASLYAANRTGAILLTAGAAAPTVRDNLLDANGVGGLVATPGTLVGVVQCNGIFETREGALATTAGVVTLGDGLHLNGATGAMRFVDNEVSGSTRFGLLLNAARATLEGNRGTANRYGVGLYGAAVVLGDGASIEGVSAAPARAPSLVEGL